MLFCFWQQQTSPTSHSSTVTIVRLQTSARKYTELIVKSGLIALSLHVADTTTDNGLIVEKLKCQEYEQKYEKMVQNESLTC